MGSTRCPGKVMKDLSGKPVLLHVVGRTSRAAALSYVLVATTVKEEDTAIEQLCSRYSIPVFRGSEEDVLGRYCHAAAMIADRFGPVDYIVRITADCPLIDPHVIDHVAGFAKDLHYDYISNTNPPTYPDGLDVEVIKKEALSEAHIHARLRSEREHVTPYIKKHDRFRKMNVTHREDLSQYRWTLDTPEDLEFMRQVYRHLYREGAFFLMDDILALLKRHPELQEINRKSERDEGYKKSIRNDGCFEGE
jgi:spore coat polysaccharide biosynthesis protein SpsF